MATTPSTSAAKPTTLDLGIQTQIKTWSSNTTPNTASTALANTFGPTTDRTLWTGSNTQPHTQTKTKIRLNRRLSKHFPHRCFLSLRGPQTPHQRIGTINLCLDFLDLITDVELSRQPNRQAIRENYKMICLWDYFRLYRDMKVISNRARTHYYDQVHTFVMRLLKPKFEKPYVTMRHAKKIMPEHVYYRLCKVTRQTYPGCSTPHTVMPLFHHWIEP